MMKDISAYLAAAALVVVAGASSASAQDSELNWRDSNRTLSSAFTTMLSSTGENSSQVTFAKVVVRNDSAGTRDVECRLALEDPGIASIDFSDVRLAAGATATLSLQVAANPDGQGFTTLKCRVSSASTSGVSMEWAKMTRLVGDSLLVDSDEP